MSRLIFKKWNSIWGFTVQEAIIYTLSLCAWLGRIDDLWSYLLWGIIKINEPYGTCWMPPEIYYSGCSFFLLCWCCQESCNKCKHRRVLIANVEQGCCDVTKCLQLCCFYQLHWLWDFLSAMFPVNFLSWHTTQVILMYRKINGDGGIKEEGECCVHLTLKKASSGWKWQMITGLFQQPSLEGQILS